MDSLRTAVSWLRYWEVRCLSWRLPALSGCMLITWFLSRSFAVRKNKFWLQASAASFSSKLQHVRPGEKPGGQWSWTRLCRRGGGTLLRCCPLPDLSKGSWSSLACGVCLIRLAGAPIGRSVFAMASMSYLLSSKLVTAFGPRNLIAATSYASAASSSVAVQQFLD